MPRSLVAGIGAVGAVALARLAVEQRRTATGAIPSTWSATRVVGPAPRGRLARRMAAPDWTSPPPPGERARRMAWAAPTSLLGALLAIGGGRWRWDAELGALVVTGARHPFLRLGGFQANALGHVIVARPPNPSRRLLQHEAAHVRQAEVLGPLTLPMYVWWLARYGYRNHPMERGARASTRAWMEGRH